MIIRKPNVDEYNYWIEESTKTQAKDRAYINNSNYEVERIELDKMIPFLLPKGLESENNYFRVIDDEDNINIGFIWFGALPGMEEDTIFLFDIMLKLECRSKGYGRKFLTEMHKQMKALGYKKIILSVLKKNYALNLYESLGYKTISEEEKHQQMILSIS